MDSKQDIELIDSHCHLEMAAFDSDREAVIQRARDAGVRYIINAGSDREGNLKGIEIAESHPEVYAAAGIHPHEASHFDEALEAELSEWAGNPRVIAIGEIGLDYHYLHSPKGVQIEAFRRQMAIARELKLPVIIHSREAEKDTMRVLRDEIDDNLGVMHCFSGDMNMARKAMELGLYISFAGPVTFKNASDLRDVARFVPDEFLLIETDAPYLSPVPYRGKRNEPAYIRHTAEMIAGIRGIGVDDLGRITSLNARRLFRIGEIDTRGAIAYKIRDSLYLNITNKCTNRCSFCIKFRTSYVKGHNLRLDRDPTSLQIIKSIGDPKRYREVVFCGIGEPLIRLDVVKKVAKWIKDQGGKVRINTNGHGNLIQGRNIIPELQGLVDSWSISLDAENEKKYNSICKPSIDGAYSGVLEFIREAAKTPADVRVTVVDIPQVNIKKCEKIAAELGVKLIVRKFDVVG
jgi:TatD DNase family protein